MSCRCTFRPSKTRMGARGRKRPSEIHEIERMDTKMKTYIGDGVYAEIRSRELFLTTENGVSITNTIVLEPDVWESLKLFMEKYS